MLAQRQQGSCLAVAVSRGTVGQHGRQTGIAAEYRNTDGLSQLGGKETVECKGIQTYSLIVYHRICYIVCSRIVVVEFNILAIGVSFLA